MNRIVKLGTSVALLSVCLLVIPANAANKTPPVNPDLTQGESVPGGVKHDITLGATGARGWMFTENLSTEDARQIYITQVAKGSPADGVLKVGDVILGVADKPFSYDARIEFAKALTVAETEATSGKLELIRWRGGQQERVIVKLAVLGSYSDTAPYDSEKSRRILERGCEALAKRIQSPDYSENPITRSLNALALLASGDPKYLPIVKKEAQWASQYHVESMATWYYGYVIMLLSEYQMASGDQSFMPGLRRLALEAADGQSAVGSWGHKFAGPDGRLQGYGMMNAAGLPLTIALVLARDAGVDDPKVERAIQRSATLLRFFIDKGTIPYGDNGPWMGSHDSNGRNSMAAVLFNLLDDPHGAEYFSHMALASLRPERDTGHTGNFWGITWAMLGIAQSGPQATGAWMKEFGSWYFDLARQWDGTFVHQGPPQNSPDHTSHWDATGAYLLAYALPLKKIYLTGKHPSKVHLVDAAEVDKYISAGRTWSKVEDDNAYYQCSQEQLLQLLSSWSPIVRERAAQALNHLDKAPIPALVKMLDSSSREARLGACQALDMLGDKAAPAVPDLRKALHSDDMWLRVLAAQALGDIGEPAMPAFADLVALITKGPSAEDPRGMEQRFVSIAVFHHLLTKLPKDLDRDLLRKAVVAALQNQDGQARASTAKIYDKLTYEELKPLLPAMVESIRNPAMSGIMSMDGSRELAVQALAKHHIREGIPLSVSFLDCIGDDGRWGANGRVPKCLDALAEYGSAAKAMLPMLLELQKQLPLDRRTKQPTRIGLMVQETIKKIEESKSSPPLRSIGDF